MNVRGLGDPYGKDCHQEEKESTLHVLRDFGIARKVWHKLVDEKDSTDFFSTNCDNWCELNLIGNSLNRNAIGD